jgi:hypothetical protein
MATRQPELTLLVVGRHGARLAGLRLEYSGETSCPAAAAQLADLLDRRPADTVIFLSHADLADALLDYLRRRGKPLPSTVISLSNGLGESNPQLDAALRRIGDAADPRELLAQLFQALSVARPDTAPLLPPEPDEREPLPPPVEEAPPAPQRPRAHRLQVVLERWLSESDDG